MISTIQKLNGRTARIVVTIVVLAILGLMWYSYRTSIKTTADANAITIAYRTVPFFPTTTYTVPYAEIAKVQQFATNPGIRKVFGANFGVVRVGTFSHPDLGSFQAVIDDINRPLLYIKTKRDDAYMISPSNLDEITAKLPH